MDDFVIQITSEAQLHDKITQELDDKMREKEESIKESQIGKINTRKEKIKKELLKDNLTEYKKKALKQELQDLNADLSFLKSLNQYPIESEQKDEKEDMLDEDDTFEGIKHNTWQVDRYVDDGDEGSYRTRLQKWVQQRTNDSGELEEEMFKPHPKHKSGKLGNGIMVPGDVYHRLFKYQKTCVKWLLELHNQEVGGIIGDEMGLGKTIQVIAFLATLAHSRKLTGPVLIVSPATIMRQWVQEFHEWWPPMRVVVLHSSGSGMFRSSSSLESYSSDEEEYSSKHSKRNGKSSPIKKMIDFIVKNGHVIITTYEGLRNYRDVILPVNWAYAFLDEGHKIRNPDADITITAKQLRTSHRIILSGTPIQNNLIELWSLYDFVFPGRLGTLPVFQAEFAIPISHGGYANASVVQVRTAHKCAAVLKDLISPYLIQRLKKDVAASLPKKTEQVLFCRLTDFQKRAYRRFLASGDVGNILEGKQHALYGKSFKILYLGIDILRKICNHPDLLSLKDRSIGVKNYGDPERSGKMKVVQALLCMWKKEGHKVLLFCQTRQMQDIIEGMIKNDGYMYLRMDGTTPIKDRSELVDRFNDTPDIFIFLLTTKVGGLGINLTGANRLILYDPDWNPASDSQARERAWRLGQKKDVTIYRLMVSGTIEEKIYQRQIFKEFLSQKILQDPRQRRFFKSNDLHDLFSLGNQEEDETETSNLFGDDVSVRTKSKGDLGQVQGVSKVSIKPFTL
jgi:DNA excision repair protein ERCC-6